MTPQEKAKELVGRFLDYASRGKTDSDITHMHYAKLCALIAVGEARNEASNLRNPLDVRFKFLDTPEQNAFDRCDFWDEVKAEIEKL